MSNKNPMKGREPVYLSGKRCRTGYVIPSTMFCAMAAAEASDTKNISDGISNPVAPSYPFRASGLFDRIAPPFHAGAKRPRQGIRALRRCL